MSSAIDPGAKEEGEEWEAGRWYRGGGARYIDERGKMLRKEKIR